MSEAHSGPRMVEIFSDLPVDDEADLAFEFEGLARTLAGLAWNPGNVTPFTAVVTGDWGRGKTTLLRRTQKLLDESRDRVDEGALQSLGAHRNPRKFLDDSPTRVEGGGARGVHTLWFNAWKYPDETTILAGLLGALLGKLNRGKHKHQAAAFLNEQRGRMGRLIVSLALPERADLGSGRTSSAMASRAFHDAFRELFAEAWLLLQNPDWALADLPHRDVEGHLHNRQKAAALAVFLDDLDRCRPTRVLEVMEAINLFLDLPGVCFYLGVDWTRLKQILEKEMSGREEAFLEKIVQVSVDLPTVTEAGVKGYVEMLLQDRVLGDLLNAGNGGIAAVASALRTTSHPRRVKRFLNDLSVGLAVLANTKRLGEGDDRVPERAVVAWHLLLASVPAADRAGLRQTQGNVVPLLRALEAGAKEEGEEVGSPITGHVKRVQENEALASWVKELTKLNGAQLTTLVHFGSPPQDAAPTRTRSSRGGTVDLIDPAGDGWVEVPGGSFQMGGSVNRDEMPTHEVSVPGFRMSRFPVTNEQYSGFVKETGRRPPVHWDSDTVAPGLENHPVVNVAWNDAQAFCEWLGRKLKTGAVDLPSEAEWEFAARGDQGREYPWGDEPPDQARANFGGHVGTTTPVSAYPSGATPSGIQDLAGNVWEWCRDRWHDNYEGAPADGSSWESGGETSRVLRGGSFFNEADYLLAAFRNHYHPENRDDHIGFRVVWGLAGGQG